jgi:hypothetical protein
MSANLSVRYLCSARYSAVTVVGWLVITSHPLYAWASRPCVPNCTARAGGLPFDPLQSAPHALTGATDG